MLQSKHFISIDFFFANFLSTQEKPLVWCFISCFYMKAWSPIFSHLIFFMKSNETYKWADIIPNDSSNQYVFQRWCVYEVNMYCVWMLYYNSYHSRFHCFSPLCTVPQTQLYHVLVAGLVDWPRLPAVLPGHAVPDAPAAPRGPTRPHGHSHPGYVHVFVNCLQQG